MLILTRHVGQEICIGDDIVIQVVDFNRDTVRIGIDAPSCVSVDRREVRKSKAKTTSCGCKPPGVASIGAYWFCVRCKTSYIAGPDLRWQPVVDKRESSR